MSTDTSLKTSPKGEIKFMAVENAVMNEKTGKAEFSIRLGFDSEKDKEFLAWVTEVNDAKVVTEGNYRGKQKETKAYLSTGKSLVNATSQFKPKIYDAKGNELEEAPYFFADSTGTAQMIVQPYYGKKGGTINLIGVIVHNIENPEGTGEGVSRETRLAQLREQVELHTK